MTARCPCWILVPALALLLSLPATPAMAATTTPNIPLSTAALSHAFRLEQHNAIELAFDTVDGNPGSMLTSFYAGTQEGHFTGDVRYEDAEMVADVRLVETGEALTLILQEEPTIPGAQRVSVRFDGIGAMAFLVRDSGITLLGHGISDCGLLEKNGLLRAIRVFLERVEPLKEQLAVQHDPRMLPLAVLDTLLRFAAHAPHLVDDCRASLSVPFYGMCELYDSYGDCITCCEDHWRLGGALECTALTVMCRGRWCSAAGSLCVAVYGYSENFCKREHCEGKNGSSCGQNGTCRTVCSETEVPVDGVCDDPINQNSYACCAPKDGTNCQFDSDCKDGDCCVDQECTSCNPTD